MVGMAVALCACGASTVQVTSESEAAQSQVVLCEDLWRSGEPPREMVGSAEERNLVTETLLPHLQDPEWHLSGITAADSETVYGRMAIELDTEDPAAVQRVVDVVPDDLVCFTLGVVNQNLPDTVMDSLTSTTSPSN